MFSFARFRAERRCNRTMRRVYRIGAAGSPQTMGSGLLKFNRL
jgi:hypothetical protein